MNPILSPASKGDDNVYFTPHPATTSFAVPASSCTCRSTLGQLNSQKPSQTLAKSAVDISTPSLLTDEILTIGDYARSCYDAVRLRRASQEAQLLKKNPFLALPLEDIEAYFAAVVDAKNALELRNSVVAFDIRNLLESLLPKLALYEQDDAILGPVFEDFKLIKEACSERNLSVDYYALEYTRYKYPTLSPSILEEHGALFSEIERYLARYNDSQQAVRHFLQDSSALRERRLRGLSTFQR